MQQGTIIMRQPFMPEKTILLPGRTSRKKLRAIIFQKSLHYSEDASCALRIAMRNARGQSGVSLFESSWDLPMMVIFLRHFCCSFCKTTLTDIARLRHDIEMEGVGIVLVHMGDDKHAEQVFTDYGLGDICRIADKNRELYRAFRLKQGRFLQVFGPKVRLHRFRKDDRVSAGDMGCGLGSGSGNGRRKRAGAAGYGRLMGNMLQLPGVFLVHQGEFVRIFRHKNPAVRPDYIALADYPMVFPGGGEGRWDS